MKIYSRRNRGPLYLLTLALFSGSLTALVMFSAEPSARLALPDSIWNLTTDDTKLSIGIDSSGQLALYELSNPATGWNWLSAPALVPLMSEVFTAAKQKVTVHWIFKDAHLDQRDGQKQSVRFTCASPALELRSEWWARPGRGPIRHAMFIRNASGQAIQFTPQASIDLTLAAPNGNNKVLQAWYVNDEVGEGAVATLVNGLGQVVLTKKLGAGSLNIIGLPNFNSGIYLLNINDKGTTQTIKIMIRK